MDTRVILLLAAEAALALVLLHSAGVLKKPVHVILSAVLMAAAFALRGSVLYWQTNDYNDFWQNGCGISPKTAGFPD